MTAASTPELLTPPSFRASSEPIPSEQVSSVHRSYRAPSWVRALRPRQWVKNALVVAAPAAAGTILSWGTVASLLVAFAAMCAAASATYLVNDISDRERDRLHPTKRQRPIAAGDLPVAVAWVQAGVLAGTALLLGLTLGGGTAIAVATYLGLTFAYSRWIKHLPFVELGGVAAGFVLRVLIGAAATATPVTAPFMVVVAAGSLFLAAGKRYAELTEMGPSGAAHRPVLAHYSAAGLENIIVGSVAAAVSAYAVWASFAEPLSFATGWLALSVVGLAAVVLRALKLVLAGCGGDPTELILGDQVIHRAGALAAACAFVALYLL